MASTTDKITSTRNSARPNSARVSVTRIAAATSLSCDNLAGWPTISKVHFVTYKIDTNNNVIAGSQLDCSGIVSGNTIGSLSVIDGTDAGNAIGDVVEMLPTAAWGKDLYDALTTSMNNDGTMITNLPLTTPKVTTGIKDANGAIMNGYTPTASAVNYVNDTNSATGNDPIISAAGSDAARNLNLRGKGLAKTVTIGAGAATIFPYDFVLSGLVLAGTGYGSTLAWTMTSGVVVINGNPITVASASGTVTASKDTYFDVLDNGDGTGLLVNTAGNIVANNAASPALASNSIRIGIIVSGANIAAATSVNQGQETMVLPIASSVPYAVTDSLGNLICPRDPNRKLLGHRRNISTPSTTSTTSVLVTGMSAGVIAPASRKLKLTASGYGALVTGTSGEVRLFRGATSGALTTDMKGMFVANGSEPPLAITCLDTPGAGTWYYSLAYFTNNVLDAISLPAGSNNPLTLDVELA